MQSIYRETRTKKQTNEKQRKETSDGRTDLVLTYQCLNINSLNIFKKQSLWILNLKIYPLNIGFLSKTLNPGKRFLS